MLDSQIELKSAQTLDLPRHQVNTKVQKLCQQGNDSAFRGEHQQAIEFYHQAIALDPNLVLAYCDRADSLLALKDYRQAEIDYKIALRLSPALAIADGGLARVYYALSKYPAALVACNLAIQRDPQNLDFYHCRALINKKLQDHHSILLDCKFILEQ